MTSRAVVRSGLVVLVMLACSPLNLLSRSSTSPTETAVSSGTTGESTPLAPETAIEEWVELEPPPPAGIIEAIEAKVDSGEWTYEQGLIQSLMIFTGEVAPADAFGEAPGDLEGTGLVFEAQRYLASGTDQAAKEEIERLLNIVAPDPERLLEYAAPAEAAHGRGGLARPADLAVDCAALWYDGFPTGQNLQCYQYKQDEFLGSTIRVFIPQQSDLIWGFQSGYADAAITAVKNSLAAFSGFSINGKAAVLDDVDVVFTLINTPKGDALAIVPLQLAGTQGCRTMIYPGAVVYNENNKPTEGDFRLFEQVVAHEMFHCFTAWNFPAHWLGAMNYGWGVIDWWGEGAAEYFSNTVYPEVNLEWVDNLQDWAYNSTTRSLVDMSYENFGFFQFLGNTLGNNGVLSFLASIPPTSDVAGQEAGLAAYPNIAVIFDDYARAYMDGTIKDSGGDVLPTAPAFVRPEYRLEISQAQSLNLAAAPFVLMRYGLIYNNDRVYLNNATVSGAGGFDAARPRELAGAWKDLPPEVTVTCAPTKFYYLLTTADAAGALFEVELRVDIKSELACDECLIGVWDLNEPSFQEYSEAPFAEIPGFYHYGGADGLFRYTFRADGTMRGEFNFTYLYAITQDNSPYGEDIRIDGAIELNGDGEGLYTTSGAGHLTMTLADDSVSMANTMFMNGEEVGESAFGATLPNKPYGYNYGSGVMSPQYSCDDDTGKLFLNFVPSSDVLPPLQFDRN